LRKEANREKEVEEEEEDSRERETYLEESSRGRLE